MFAPQNFSNAQQKSQPSTNKTSCSICRTIARRETYKFSPSNQRTIYPQFTLTASNTGEKPRNATLRHLQPIQPIPSGSTLLTIQQRKTFPHRLLGGAAVRRRAWGPAACTLVFFSADNITKLLDALRPPPPTPPRGAHISYRRPAESWTKPLPSTTVLYTAFIFHRVYSISDYKSQNEIVRIAKVL
jgi:hypothetical protein